MKKAAHIVYQHAAKEMKKKLNGKNKHFYEILAKLIFDSATRGDESIELVKLEKGFSRIVFNNDFKKRYADLLSKQKITVVFNDDGDPIVAVYVGTVNTKNKLFQIRVKVEAASSTTAAGKKYKPYMRNYIESGKKMFELAEQLEELKK
jgi:sugar diacid utilization regulator